VSLFSINPNFFQRCERLFPFSRWPMCAPSQPSLFRLDRHDLCKFVTGVALLSMTFSLSPFRCFRYIGFLPWRSPTLLLVSTVSRTKLSCSVRLLLFLWTEFPPSVPSFVEAESRSRWKFRLFTRFPLNSRTSPPSPAQDSFFF